MSTQDVQHKLEQLRNWIDECPKGGMVFFGGAGVSTESGIPDFRSADGLYSQKFSYPPERMLSHGFFIEHPQEFFRFYFDRMVVTDVQPNQAHKKLAELEEKGICQAVITQNIDGLHQAAGSKNVLELHGSIHRNYCMTCKRAYDLDGMIALHEASEDGVPHCETCGGIVRPDVVLYEEPLDQEVVQQSVYAIAQADLMVVAGTSLMVQPAAGMLGYFQGSKLVIVNLNPTAADSHADLCISAKVGEVFSF